MMTLPEIREELRYRFEERLALLCAEAQVPWLRKPDPKQIALAKQEAWAWLEQYRNQNPK